LPPLHWSNALATAAWFIFHWMGGRYSFGQNPPEEIHNSAIALMVSALMHLSVLLSVGAASAPRFFMLLVWVLSLPLCYLARSLWRQARSDAGTYGVPVVVVGNGLAARRAIRELKSHPRLGFVPIALFSTERAAADEFRQIQNVPMIGRSEEAASFPFSCDVRHVVLAIGAGWGDERNHDLARELSRRYKHLQLFTNLTGTGHWMSQARPLGPYVTVHTQNVRLTPSQRFLKRALDVTICLPALIVTLPLILLAGIAIKLSDPGSAFFSQVREGRGGKPIKIYKLRSMINGAEQALARYLADNPAARAEYERTMKLRQDPRIIPVVGKFIRKTSIDELPQLWSIVKGDMSLVGPRVMPTREVDLYSQSGREMRRDMPPGLTGFWQVEHRNDSDFQIREVADSFYVANWSIWLDIWIILRTVRVVLTGSGAF
jgi:Undecaprenyl-phosphate galactose phosphotransferase WbaP